MKRVFSALIVLTVCAVLAFPGATNAVTQKQRVVVSPSKVEFALAPGESATRVITVVNKGTQPFMLNMSAMPYSIGGEDYGPRYTVLPGTLDASKWVTFINPSGPVRVEPEKVREVMYRVDVPESVKPGGYYVALFATTTPDPTPNSVVSHNRVAITQYITVEGAARHSGRATAERFSAAVWGSVLTMPYSVKNTGEDHFIAKVSAVVKTLWGSEVSRVYEERCVLQKTERRITLNWQTKGAFGIYKVEQTVEYLGRTEQLSPRWIFVAQPAVFLGVVLLITGCVTFVVIRMKHPRQPRSKH